MSAEHLNELLEAAAKLDTYLNAKLDDWQEHCVDNPGANYDEAAGCLLRMIGANAATVRLLQADLQQEVAHG